MTRPTCLAHDDLDDDDFDMPAKLAILRRAVAEIALPASDSSALLATARAELARFSVLAELTFGMLGEDELLCKAQRLTVRVKERAPERATLEAMRAQLHAWLVRAAHAVVALDDSFAPTRPVDVEVEGALALRRLLSEFHGSLLSRTDDSNLPWALLVAEAELSLLLKHPALARSAARDKRVLVALRARIRRWRLAKRDPSVAAKLYAEVLASSNLLSVLTRRHDVRRHDTRVLRELAAVLAYPKADLAVALHAAEKLIALRGLDAQLDRLIRDLPFDPSGVLARISRRVSQLRARPVPS